MSYLNKNVETHQLAPPSGEPPQLPEFAARVLENASSQSKRIVLSTNPGSRSTDCHYKGQYPSNQTDIMR